MNKEEEKEREEGRIRTNSKGRMLEKGEKKGAKRVASWREARTEQGGNGGKTRTGEGKETREQGAQLGSYMFQRGLVFDSSLCRSALWTSGITIPSRGSKAGKRERKKESR